MAVGFGLLVTVPLEGVFFTGVFTGVSVFSLGFATVLAAGLDVTFVGALAGSLTSFLETSEVFGVADLLVFLAGIIFIFESPLVICKIILQKFSTGFSVST